MASMLYLTSEVDDPNRKKEERDCAAETLTVFTAEDLALFGLEADLAAHGAEFLRLFDVHMPDPALLPRRLRQFSKETKWLFMKAMILHRTNAGTVSAIVLQTLANSRATFFWRDEVRSLSWVGNREAVRRAMRRVQTVARLLLETLELEFHDDLFPQWWEIFDLSSWLEVREDSPAEVALWSKFNKLCRSRGGMKSH